MTTKVWILDAGFDRTLSGFPASLEKPGLGYVDLYLIHQPYGDVYGSWRSMQELVEQSRVPAIGVSNFSPVELRDLALFTGVAPAVDQIEIHPFLQKARAVEATGSVYFDVEDPETARRFHGYSS